MQDSAYMGNIYSKICAGYVRKDYLTFICVQMLQISHYLPVHCVKGAEFASFAVHFWSSLDWLLVCLLLVRIQRILHNSRELWANCTKSG